MSLAIMHESQFQRIRDKTEGTCPGYWAKGDDGRIYLLKEGHYEMCCSTKLPSDDELAVVEVITGQVIRSIFGKKFAPTTILVERTEASNSKYYIASKSRETACRYFSVTKNLSQIMAIAKILDVDNFKDEHILFNKKNLNLYDGSKKQNAFLVDFNVCYPFRPSRDLGEAKLFSSKCGYFTIGKEVEPKYIYKMIRKMLKADEDAVKKIVFAYEEILGEKLCDEYFEKIVQTKEILRQNYPV